MKLEIHVPIYDQTVLMAKATKIFETDIQPFLGLELQDDAWEETIKIKTIVVNYNTDKIYVEMEACYLYNNEDFHSVHKNFISNGWIIV